MSVKTVAEIAVIADAKQAIEEMKRLAAATGKTFDQIKKQVDGVKELGNKWNELSKSMVGFEMHDAFKKISDGAKEATGGVLDLNMAFAGYKVAGPWGAAVGAVGVAVAKSANLMNAMGVSVDDLEKKAQAAAREGIANMTGKLGEMGREFLANADATKAMNERLADTPYRLAKVFEGFQLLYPALKKAREEIQQFDSAPARVNRALGAGSKGLQDFIGDAVNRYLGVSGWNPLKYKTVAKGKESYDDAATAAGIDAMSRLYGSGQVGNFDVLQMLSDRADAKSASDTSDLIRSLGPSGDVPGGSLDLEMQLNEFYGPNGAMRQRNRDAYGAYNKGKEQSFLEKTFGPVDQFDLYAQGFQMLSGAVGASLSAWIDGSMSAGQAFKKFIGEALKGLAVQMSMEALKHGAYALGSLAFGDFRGAAQHGQAAGLFAVGAAAAAVAAREFGTGAKAPAAGGRAPNVTGARGGGTREPERIIVYSDAFAEDNARGRQLQAERMVQRAYGNSAVRRE